MLKKPRMFVGKVGLDGHTTGIYAVSKALSDAGVEVIFGGIRMSPEELAAGALQEDVDAIGISILSGAHLTVVKKLIKSLKERGLENMPVFVGGIVPPEDIPKLESMGVSAVFTPGSSMSKILVTVKSLLERSAKTA